jgi:hypothetical protein
MPQSGKTPRYQGARPGTSVRNAKKQPCRDDQLRQILNFNITLINLEMNVDREVQRVLKKIRFCRISPAKDGKTEERKRPKERPRQ